MTAYTASPGPFKAREADPEATLEGFEDYLEMMVRVFRLSRRIHPTTGAKIEMPRRGTCSSWRGART